MDDRYAFDLIIRERAWGGLVRAAREGAGMSQWRLAEALQCSQSVVSRLESPKYLPTIRTLARVAAATGAEFSVSMRVGEGYHRIVFDGKDFVERRSLQRKARVLSRSVDRANHDGEVLLHRLMGS